MRNGFRIVAAWAAVWLVVVVGLVGAVRPAQAQNTGCVLDVALLGAETAQGRLAEMATAIGKDPRIKSVETFQIDAMTPSVADLLRFDAVLVWTNSGVADNTALGDNLADYVDLGGGVVIGMWVFAAPQQTQSIGGRFLSENYYCIMRMPGTKVSGHAVLGVVHDPSHPMMEDVVTFDGGTSSFRTLAPIHPSAVRVADWDTGEPLVVVRDDLEGVRVDLGLWPVSNASASNGWDETTDGWQLLTNALYFVSPCSGAAGFSLCEGPIASSAVPDPDIGCVTIRSGVNTSKEWVVSVPFSSGTGGDITTITFWGVYEKKTAPALQNFRIEFVRLTNEHEKVHIALASAIPVETGFNQTASGSPLPIYEFQLVLDLPFETVANEELRMTIVPEGERTRLCWQLASTTGSHLRIHDDGTITTNSGTLAYAICRPGGAIGCFSFGGTTEKFSGSTRFRGLGLSFLFDEHLTEITAELSLVEPTELHWLVFESESLQGEYALVHESLTTPLRNGQALYSSGPIDVLVRGDRFYMVGFAWGVETVTYYWARAPSPPGIPHPWPLGTMEFAYGLNDFQLPITGPIQFDPNKLNPLSEYNIALCFGGSSPCMCDLFDTSTGRSVCDLFDIVAFQTALSLGDPAACNLDTSTGPGVCDIFDFIAFHAAYAEGCP